MLVDFSTANLIDKAKLQPDKVSQTIDKLKTDGIISTYKAVKNKLQQPIQLGYCNAGVVIGIADDVTEFKLGDRVLSNGPHSEIVCVSKNLATIIPDNVSIRHAPICCSWRNRFAGHPFSKTHLWRNFRSHRTWIDWTYNRTTS